MTDRQRQVVALLAAGHTVAETAKALGLAYQTVAWHLSRLRGHLGVETTSAAVVTMLQAGELEAPVATPVRLPPADRAVLECLAEGASAKQTAQRLGRTVKAVEVSRTRIYRALGVRGRWQATAVAWALQHGEM